MLNVCVSFLNRVEKCILIFSLHIQSILSVHFEMHLLVRCAHIANEMDRIHRDISAFFHFGFLFRYALANSEQRYTP